jgi:hypothetical protein
MKLAVTVMRLDEGVNAYEELKIWAGIGKVA